MHASVHVCILHHAWRFIFSLKALMGTFILILDSALCWIAFLSSSLVLSSLCSFITLLLSSVGIFSLIEWGRLNSVVLGSLNIWNSVCVFHRSKQWRLRNWICWESKIWLSTQSFSRDVQNRRASWRREMISTHSYRYFGTRSIFKQHRKAFATIKHCISV